MIAPLQHVAQDQLDALCHRWRVRELSLFGSVARGDEDFRLLVDSTLARLYRSKTIDKIFARNFANAKPSDVLRALYIINALPE